MSTMASPPTTQRRPEIGEIGALRYTRTFESKAELKDAGKQAVGASIKDFYRIIAAMNAIRSSRVWKRVLRAP